jgi:hypothetical protein
MSNKQFRQTVFASATGQSPVVAEAAERHMKVTRYNISDTSVWYAPLSREHTFRTAYCEAPSVLVSIAIYVFLYVYAIYGPDC